MSKIILFVLSFVILLLTSYTPINAQTYLCGWSESTTICRVTSDNCGANYKLPSPNACDLVGANETICKRLTSALPCIPKSCAGAGESCSTLPCCSGLCADPPGGGTGKVCSDVSSNPGQGPVIDVKGGPPLENCEGGKGIKTAIGCIPIESEQSLATFFLGWGMGLGGGIALILIVVSTFMIMTSAGDPRKLQAGKELLTSAISGLILLVFAAYILRVIGVDLLGIFSGGGGTGGGPPPGVDPVPRVI
jgi:hypothetical protein